MANIGPGLKILGMTVILAFLAGCASKPPEDVTLKGSLVAVESVNPDSQGRPSPLVIKIYQLEAKDKFELADFFPLFDQPESTLGSDMLGVEDVMLSPGESRPYEGEFDPQTRFIGVVAAFRDINQARWKAVVPMPEKSRRGIRKSGGLVVKADNLAIDITVGN